MNNQKRAAFSEPEEIKPAESKVKLDANKSKFAKSAEKPSISQLEDKVAEFQEKNKEISQKAFDLSSRFMSLIRSRILKENKSPLDTQIETDIVRGLSSVALELNNDDTQPEGIGSVGVITLLLRVVLVQSEKINNLEYKLVQLEKKIQKSTEDKV